MAHSLSPECTPLKHAYDSCFNTWFESYLQPAVAQNANATPAQRTEYSKKKAEDFETNCGGVWREYKACVQKAVKDRGLSDLLEQARDEHPLKEQPSIPVGPSKT
ncbi:hypothetical protein CONPUDRAFT_108712 [Coniophora puteana RWD-64-598 SS2]|uniref:Uncharacterized protein n=1 Tax=Coniophora puteana (strain RWD-64-598) TaxID=741705 RepID=A0A5M3MJA9_CONPW|nr:uncharacterized protein CONPUDRAFT_108712 [Coniophora puteana RWD-64-598 SS2]EIW78715.1 hypothetical protein CONPUDRAFT_108712 [Coniophora puteana RWD-64-598 SS2]